MRRQRWANNEPVMSLPIFLSAQKENVIARLILHTSQGAHQAGDYPGFRSMKRLGVFLLAPGWDTSPS